MSHRDAYTAIADPTRREILGLLLSNGPLPAGEIASNFASTSRPGISRHLRVLKECGVVTAHKEGKTRRYSLRPEPLRDLHSGWLAQFATRQAASLRSLRARAEAKGPEESGSSSGF